MPVKPALALPLVQALGDVFSALAAAVGAADKVIELMHRRPRVPHGGTLAPPEFSGTLELEVSWQQAGLCCYLSTCLSCSYHA